MTCSHRLLGVATVCTFYVPVAFAAGAQDADTAEIAAYRLTMDGFKKVITVTKAMMEQMAQDPKFKEAKQIEAELEALGKKDEPTEADEKRMEALAERQQALEEAVDNPLGGDAKSLSEMEARITRHPALMQALQRESMPPREYAKFWLAYIQAAFAHGFQKSGLVKELPKDVNTENVKFIADHESELQAIQKEFEALGRK